MSNFACQEIQTSNRATKLLSFKINPFYPWKNEDLITGFNSYMESCIDKQDVMHKNIKSFNENCERFDSALETFENDVIPQSAWDSIVPSIAEENAVTNT